MTAIVQRSQPLGTETLDFRTIAPEVLVELLEELYQDTRIREVPSIFRTIADFMRREDGIFPVRVPHDIANFYGGLSARTLVSPSLVEQIKRDDNPVQAPLFDEPPLPSWLGRYLLLCRPVEEGELPTWALWEIHAVSKKDGAVEERVAIRSVVRTVEREEVADIFRTNPTTAAYLLNADAKVQDYAEKAGRRARELHNAASRFRCKRRGIRFAGLIGESTTE